MLVHFYIKGVMLLNIINRSMFVNDVMISI